MNFIMKYANYLNQKAESQVWIKEALLQVDDWEKLNNETI